MQKYEALELEVVVINDDVITTSQVDFKSGSPVINFFGGSSLTDEQA